MTVPMEPLMQVTIAEARVSGAKQFFSLDGTRPLLAIVDSGSPIEAWLSVGLAFWESLALSVGIVD